MAQRCIALLALAGCGRFAFDPLTGVDGTGDGNGGGTDDARGMGDANDSGTSPAGVVAWVKPFVQQVTTAPGSGGNFTASATNTGDLIVLHVSCQSNQTPSLATVSGAGWTFINPALIVNNGNMYATSIYAFAPFTANTVFTIQWIGANCNARTEIGDDFAGAGSPSFHTELAGTGNCNTSIQTRSDNEAVWSGCTTTDVVGVGPGYTKGADNGAGDWTEHKLTSDPAGTTETPSFVTSGSAAYVATTLVIPPK